VAARPAVVLGVVAVVEPDEVVEPPVGADAVGEVDGLAAVLEAALERAQAEAHREPGQERRHEQERGGERQRAEEREDERQLEDQAAAQAKARGDAGVVGQVAVAPQGLRDAERHGE
jgi:hypothetical protein